METIEEKNFAVARTLLQHPTWKVLIVDDDQSVHDITKLVLNDVKFDNKKLTFLHAYNIEDSKKLLNAHPDIAVVILDVVMETQDAGLTVVRYIRDYLKNKVMRIILRTGQPGAAPENKIVSEYDINDYKEKTELSSSKFNTLLITSLRAYKELMESYLQQISIREEADKQLTEKDEYLRMITDALPVLISFIDNEQCIQFYNKTYQVWFNKKDTDIFGLNVKELIGDVAYKTFSENWEKATHGHTINFDMRLQHNFFGMRNTNVTLVPHTYMHVFRGCFALISDITERKQIEENLNYLAKHDVLTGLYNRTFFNSYINQEIKITLDRGKMFALLFIDVDEFKKINDTKGHEYGDLILLGISERLKECVRGADIICRFGGDEFVILLGNIKDEREVKNIAEKILKSIALPYEIKDQKLSVTSSIGISICPQDGTDKDVLLKNADLAMYKVKAEGKNGFQLYSEKLFKDISTRFEIENELRASINNEEFEVYYQPIVDLQSGKSVAVEALVRWIHPVRGMILPNSFINITEQSNSLIPFSEWILKTACQNLKQLQKETGISDLKVTVNISPHQFVTDNFIDFIKQVLTETNLSGEFLEIELTEGTLISNFDIVFNNIQELREMKVGVLLDDFGSGFSSLNYLARLPITGIKIDESFSKAIATDLRSAAIVSTIIQLMHSLKIKTVVEAIETSEQLIFAHSCHCDMVQGFLVCKPVPLNEVKESLKKIDITNLLQVKNQ